jgi:hypothetical protein
MAKFNLKFVPSTNKEGYSKLTFKGIVTKEGKAGDVSKTGKTYEKDWEFTSLEFEMMGLVKGTSKTFYPKLETEYADNNKFGVLLQNMGYERPDLEPEYDDDGFLIMSDENVDLQIEEFLESVKDKIFIAVLIYDVDDKGYEYYDIQVDTVKPLN